MSVVITIPIYRDFLSATEKVSLMQVKRILGKYPCVFVAPESLVFDYEGLENGIAVERFPILRVLPATASCCSRKSTMNGLRLMIIC